MEGNSQEEYLKALDACENWTCQWQCLWEWNSWTSLVKINSGDFNLLLLFQCAFEDFFKDCFKYQIYDVKNRISFHGQ